MRKGLLIAIVAIGTTITGSAQTSQSGFSMTAAHLERIDGQTVFSGKVEIVVAGVRVRADNATIHSDAKTIDLSGHVQLTLQTK